MSAQLSVCPGPPASQLHDFASILAWWCFSMIRQPWRTRPLPPAARSSGICAGAGYLPMRMSTPLARWRLQPRTTTTRKAEFATSPSTRRSRFVLGTCGGVSPGMSSLGCSKSLADPCWHGADMLPGVPCRSRALLSGGMPCGGGPVRRCTALEATIGGIPPKTGAGRPSGSRIGCAAMRAAVACGIAALTSAVA